MCLGFRVCVGLTTRSGRAIAEALDADALASRHPLDRAQYVWIKTMLEGQILTWGGDRVDMANSMESRPAFLDHHLAEFAVRIPPKLRIRDGVEKWVLREAMKEVLPEVLYKRKKFAFMAPPGDTDSAKQRAVDQLIERWLAPDRVEGAGIFEPHCVEEFLERSRVSKDAVQKKRQDIILNHLLQIQMLHEQFASKDLHSAPDRSDNCRNDDEAACRELNQTGACSS